MFSNEKLIFPLLVFVVSRRFFHFFSPYPDPVVTLSVFFHPLYHIKNVLRREKVFKPTDKCIYNNFVDALVVRLIEKWRCNIFRYTLPNRILHIELTERKTIFTMIYLNLIQPLHKN